MPLVESPLAVGEGQRVESYGDNMTANVHDDETDQGDSTVNDVNNGSPDFDDDSRKLFVGGLSWQTTENDLREYFSRWGKVTQCIIKLDRYTGNSRGFGFVTMENEDCVNNVLSISDHWLKNKRIDPKKAKPSKETLRKVFVGGIHPDVTEDQIREYFSAFGKVESLDLPFDAQRGKRKHYIFVSFANEAAARKAIHRPRQEIFGRQCDVRMAVTREQANRQKALKQWSPWLDEFSYPNLAFGEMSNPYLGYDPFLYGYHGCDYSNVPGHSYAYPAMTANPFCPMPGNPTKLPNTHRDPVSCGAMGPLANATRFMGPNNAASLSNASHRAQTTNQSQPQTSSANYDMLNAANTDAHHNPYSTNLGVMEMCTNPSLQNVMANVAAAAAAAGYPLSSL